MTIQKKYFVSSKSFPAFGQIIFAFSAAEAKFIAHGRFVPIGTTAKIVK